MITSKTVQKIFIFDRTHNGPEFGVFAFQRVMFNGLAKVENNVCKLSRNIFFEAPVIAPFSVVSVKYELFQYIKRWIDAFIYETYDEFLFNMPYELGRPSRGLGSLAAWPDKFVEERSVLLHPFEAASENRYVAFDPMPAHKLPISALSEFELTSPFSNSIAFRGKFVRDAALLDRIGIVGTGFGFQISERVSIILREHLLAPYFQVADLLV
jgi:hypothetical protein